MKCGSEILWKETPSGSAEVITIAGFGRGRVELRSAVLQEGALLGGDPASCFRVGYGSQRAPFFPCSIPVCSQLCVWLRMNWVLGALQCSLRYRTRWPQPLLWERWCWSCRAVWAHGHTASSCREHGRGLAAGGRCAAGSAPRPAVLVLLWRGCAGFGGSSGLWPQLCPHPQQPCAAGLVQGLRGCRHSFVLCSLWCVPVPWARHSRTCAGVLLWPGLLPC